MAPPVPLLLGGVKLIKAALAPGVADRLVGALGVVCEKLLSTDNSKRTVQKDLTNSLKFMLCFKSLTLRYWKIV